MLPCPEAPRGHAGCTGLFLAVLSTPTAARDVIVVDDSYLPAIGEHVLFLAARLDASGTLQLSGPAPPVVNDATFYHQGIVVSASPFGEVVFSSAGAVTLLAPSP